MLGESGSDEHSCRSSQSLLDLLSSVSSYYLSSKVYTEVFGSLTMVYDGDVCRESTRLLLLAPTTTE